MHVLDTSTIIHFFRGHPRVVAHLMATPSDAVVVPAVVAYELWTGVEKSTRPTTHAAQLRTFLDAVEVRAFGEQEAREAARLRARLEAQGTPIGPHDTLIAATALRARGVLVTQNTREFRRVEGLLLADWTLSAP